MSDSLTRESAESLGCLTLRCKIDALALEIVQCHATRGIHDTSNVEHFSGTVLKRQRAPGEPHLSQFSEEKFVPCCCHQTRIAALFLSSAVLTDLLRRNCHAKRDEEWFSFPLRQRQTSIWAMKEMHLGTSSRCCSLVQCLYAADQHMESLHCYTPHSGTYLCSLSVIKMCECVNTEISVIVHFV